MPVNWLAFEIKSRILKITKSSLYTIMSIYISKPSIKTISSICQPIIGIILLILAVFSNAALADYVLPPVAERYYLLADSWHLSKSAKNEDELALSHGGDSYLWKIDRFLLADRTNSDSICIGANDAFTRSYLDKLARLPKHPLIKVELVNEKTGAPLVVAGIWPYDSAHQWEYAIKNGSNILNLSAEQVKALGSSVNYQKKLLEYFDQEWIKLADRP